MPTLEESQQDFITTLPNACSSAEKGQDLTMLLRTGFTPTLSCDRLRIKGKKYPRFPFSKPSYGRLLAKTCWFIALPETVLRALLNIAELCNTPMCRTFSLFLTECRVMCVVKQAVLAAVWWKMLSIFVIMRRTLGLDGMRASPGEDFSWVQNKTVG